MLKSRKSRKTGKKVVAGKRTRAKRTRQRKSSHRWKAFRRRMVRFGVSLTLLFIVAWVGWLDYTVQTEFDAKRWSAPARVYARPLELYAGRAMRPLDLVAELKALGYRASSSAVVRSTSYQVTTNQVRLHSRAFSFGDGHSQARQILVRFDAHKIIAVVDVRTKRSLDIYRLEPVYIGSINPAASGDRLQVSLENIPPLLIEALVATEDRGFYHHIGVDPRGIARAMWANVKAGGIVQGGSTITQQLAKNFFLSPERSIVRKLNEAVMALLLEFHYDKDDILEAYLNEVYLGQDGARGIQGVGLASLFYFNKSLDQLNLGQSALLVGLVKGASYYNPRRHPKRAKKRRDLVVQALFERGVISQADRNWTIQQALGVTTKPAAGPTHYPAYLSLVRRQLSRDYPAEVLATKGLRIFTALDPDIQRVAESALSGRLAEYQKGRRVPKGTRLEGAVIVTSTDTGEVLAVVGGRQARFTGFNRALDAIRPIGSLVKPAVYLTALSQSNQYSLVSPVSDDPIEVDTRNSGIWAPKNYDKKFHGEIELRRGLIESLNVATVRLGLSLGVRRVIETLQNLGVHRPMSAYPSALLGTMELSPIEVAQMYQTLAAGGFYSPLKTIREVLSKQGDSLQRYPVTVQRRVNGAAVKLVTTALQEATRIGTSRSLMRRLPNLVVAGKTGTTNDLRDSWFAGFSADKVAVVWLGNDNNKTTGLTGSSGALPVWADIFSELRTESISADLPEGMLWRRAPERGNYRGESCEAAERLPFIAGSPAEGWVSCAASKPVRKQERTFDWFRSLFD